MDLVWSLLVATSAKPPRGPTCSRACVHLMHHVDMKGMRSYSYIA